MQCRCPCAEARTSSALCAGGSHPLRVRRDGVHAVQPTLETGIVGRASQGESQGLGRLDSGAGREAFPGAG